MKNWAAKLPPTPGQFCVRAAGPVSVIDDTADAHRTPQSIVSAAGLQFVHAPMLGIVAHGRRPAVSLVAPERWARWQATVSTVTQDFGAAHPIGSEEADYVGVARASPTLAVRHDTSPFSPEARGPLVRAMEWIVGRPNKLRAPSTITIFDGMQRIRPVPDGEKRSMALIHTAHTPESRFRWPTKVGRLPPGVDASMTVSAFIRSNATFGLAASLFWITLALAPVSAARAADLQVLAGGAMTAPLQEIASRFESRSGHKIVFRFGTTPELIKLVTTGGPFDLGIVPREVLKDEAAAARFVSGPTRDVARVGLGVAVRQGAPRPDVSTPDTLKQTLLHARSIATIPASAAGYQVLAVFERLGIADEMKARIRPQTAPAALVQAVANGDAELGVFLINVLTAPGLDVAGPFPRALQQEVVFTAGVAADTRQSAAARALLDYLTTPEAGEIIKAKGMTPG